LSNSTPIRIANPEALEGKTYTSAKRALHLVRRGDAVFLDNGHLYISPLYNLQPSFKTSEHDPVTGEFEWGGADSAGYQVMQAQHLSE